jgi:ferredoxin-NADP reductase
MATHGASSDTRGTEGPPRLAASPLVERRGETESAATLVLEAGGWPGHLAGQHIDVRMTAPDGYQAARSYSLAAPTDGDRIEITVQRVADGEVSSCLVDEARNGDRLEVRGPVGGWCVWQPADSAGTAGGGRVGRGTADGDDSVSRRSWFPAVPAP